MTSSAPPEMTNQAQPESAPVAQNQQQGLPPTGLQQQLQSINSLYQGVQSAQGGFNVQQQQFQQAQNQAGGATLQVGPGGSSSLDQMARNMAQQYGMPIGAGRLVDENGNFLVSPAQLADASGGTMTQGEAAAQMNYISQALARRQNEERRAQGIAALEQGLGLVQSNARGSLAAMTSGYYQSLAGAYMDPNQQVEAQDFSFYIQQEQLEIQQELMRRQEKLAKKQARGQFLGGIGLGIAGFATGNISAGIAGAGMASGSAGGTGWF